MTVQMLCVLRCRPRAGLIFCSSHWAEQEDAFSLRGWEESRRNRQMLSLTTEHERAPWLTPLIPVLGRKRQVTAVSSRPA